MIKKILIFITLILHLVSYSQTCFYGKPINRLSHSEFKNAEINSQDVFAAYSNPKVVRRLLISLKGSTYNRIVEEKIDFTKFENLTHLYLLADTVVDISFILNDLNSIKGFTNLSVTGMMDVSGMTNISTLTFSQQYGSNDSLQMHSSIYNLKNLDVLRLYLRDLSVLPPLSLASELSCLYINTFKVEYFPPLGSDLKYIENLKIEFESNLKFNLNEKIFRDIKTLEFNGYGVSTLTLETGVSSYSGQLIIMCDTLIGFPDFIKRCDEKSQIVVYADHIEIPQDHILEPIRADYVSIHIGKWRWRNRRSWRYLRKLKKVSEKFNPELIFRI